MFDVFSQCLQIIVALVQGYLLQYFLGSFLESRYLHGKWNRLGVMASCVAMTVLQDNCLPQDYGSARFIGKTILSLVVFFVIALCFYKAMRAITVFLVVTFLAVSDICFFIAYTFMRLGAWFSDWQVELYGQGYFSSYKTFLMVLEISLMAVSILMEVMYLVMLYCSLRRIIAAFGEKDYIIQKKELYFLLTPSLVGLLLCILLRIMMITVEDEIPQLLYDRYPAFVVLIPAIMILALLSILYGVQLFQDMVILNRERNNRIVLEKQIDHMQEHVREMERVYAGVRSMKHDMKNTLSVIMQLANGEDRDADHAELQAYLAELNRSMDKLNYRFQTGNSVVDVLLNMKYHEATSKMPDLQVDAERLLFPRNLGIRSYDIGIIMGNALDNAVEACLRQGEQEPAVARFIRLASYQRGVMFFIEVENSFDGKVACREHAEFPATNKSDAPKHGMGLANIKNTAEKYYGAVDWEADNQVFRLTVMLKNERRDEYGCECNQYAD